MKETFEKLEELLLQDQFELLLPAQGEDIRLVYLMNDAVESFLVFKNAKMTGTYQADYEGELAAALSEEANGYVLAVHQGDTAVTVFFEELELETHLYHYGAIGHFWVKGYEYLRQLEYRIAILRDKYDYLGEPYTNPQECRLAALTEFPPLNACCYPAVPKKYMVPGKRSWTPSEAAVDVMLEIAKEAGDTRLKWALGVYRNHPYRWVARVIAGMLHRTAHARTVDILTERLKEASRQYPDRSFGEQEDQKYSRLLRTVEKRQKELERCGKESVILREEPFAAVKDSIDFKVYLMIWSYGVWNRRVEVETYPAEESETSGRS